LALVAEEEEQLQPLSLGQELAKVLLPIQLEQEVREELQLLSQPRVVAAVELVQQLLRQQAQA
jgi:hypothetical protein